MLSMIEGRGSAPSADGLSRVRDWSPRGIPVRRSVLAAPDRLFPEFLAQSCSCFRRALRIGSAPFPTRSVILPSPLRSSPEPSSISVIPPTARVPPSIAWPRPSAICRAPSSARPEPSPSRPAPAAARAKPSRICETPFAARAEPRAEAVEFVELAALLVAGRQFVADVFQRLGPLRDLPRARSPPARPGPRRSGAATGRASSSRARSVIVPSSVAATTTNGAS